jgi:hypothetical protein
MSTLSRIHISSVHKAIQLSVPYDLTNIVHAFYTFYSTLPLEDGENVCCQDYTDQKRFMTAEQVFKCLSLYTAGLFERNAVMERMVGHLASHSKIPYDELEACANINFK